jgi:hypothetical protein
MVKTATSVLTINGNGRAIMSEKRWPVSGREVKPWWFHALNWACGAFAAFCLLLVILVALAGWVSIL